MMNTGAMQRENDSNKRPDEPEAVIVPLKPLGGSARSEASGGPDGAADASRGECNGGARRKPGLLRFAVRIAVALFFLWLFSLSAPYVRLALEHEGWRAWAAWGCAAVPFAVAFVIFLSVKAYFRLPKIAKFEQGRKSTYSYLEELLQKYVRRYPIRSEAFEDVAGEKAEEIQNAYFAIPPLENGTGDWKEAFDKFMCALDARAAEVVRGACKGIGLKTAANPWKMLDIAIVACNSTTMVCNIATLYNRRMLPREAFSFVCRYFMNVYISGEAGALTQDMADGAAAGVPEGAAPNWLAATLPVASKVAGKVVEGGVNAFLAYRLGRFAISALRPLSQES